MEKYSIVYIDNRPDETLSRFLDKEFHNDNYIIDFSEIIFKPEEGYDSLLSNPKISAANIILIDSRLFENRTAMRGKFTGEEFKLVLKKFYPFIEVIVITQNGVDPVIQKISKYDKSSGQTASEYYAQTIPPLIEQAIINIRQYNLLASMVNMNDSWETMLKEKVMNAIQGISSYGDLSKEDVDELISAFKKIQESLNG